MNKKGSDGPSFLYAIAILFAIGFLFFIFSHMFSQVYETLGDTINNIDTIDASQANETLTNVQNFEQSMWDYAFLAILLGYVFVMLVLSFSTPTNSWFFAIFIIFGLVGLFVGVALSNAWEALVETPTLSATAERFPITDAILNNFFTLFVVFMFLAIVIMLFGKRVLGGGLGGGGIG